jgi:Tol biopolymer transport system component
MQPAWSPDGSQIAFSSNRAGSYDIWLMSSDGTNLRQLTDDFDWDRAPSWSPDGSRIAFGRKAANRIIDIWILGGQ